MENLLSDQRKFEKVTLKNDAFLNFVVNQEKCRDTIFKNLVDSNSMSKEMRKFVKPVGTRPGIMYGNFKVHKQQVDGCPPFRPILSALQTPTYNLAKFLVPILLSCFFFFFRQIFVLIPCFFFYDIFICLVIFSCFFLPPLSYFSFAFCNNSCLLNQ